MGIGETKRVEEKSFACDKEGVNALADEFCNLSASPGYMNALNKCHAAEGCLLPDLLIENNNRANGNQLEPAQSASETANGDRSAEARANASRPGDVHTAGEKVTGKKSANLPPLSFDSSQENKSAESNSKPTEKTSSTSGKTEDLMKTMLRQHIDKALDSKEPLNADSFDALSRQLQFYLKQKPTAEEREQLADKLRKKAGDELENNNPAVGMGLMLLLKKTEFAAYTREK